MQISSRFMFLLGLAAVADAASKSYTKFQSIGFSLNTGPANAIDVATTKASLPDCKYTSEDCPTEVWWQDPSDENSLRVCMACVKFTDDCGCEPYPDLTCNAQLGQSKQPIFTLNGTAFQNSKCYLGNSDTEKDVEGRIAIMQRAVEKAYEVASKDEDTLKIFIAPEFFWRGPTGFYPFDVIDNPGKEGEFNAITEIGRALEDIIRQEKFSDWMFLFGTIIAAKETTSETSGGGDNERLVVANGNKFQFLNFAPLYKGFDPVTTNSNGNGMKFIVPKVLMSNLDFLTEQRQRTPNPAFGDTDGKYDNDLLDDILDWLREIGYIVIEESWFYMNDIAMSVEICLDHLVKMAKNRLQNSSITMVPSGGFGEYRNLSKPNGAQISLVSSAGMDIKKDSLVLDAGGTIFLQDGLYAQQSQVQACEFNEPGGKQGGKWFCCEHTYSAHEVYASLGEAEAALRGLFSIVNSTMPEIHLFKPLDIISVGGGDDAISESQTTVGDVNATFDETNTATTASVKSESSSAETSTITIKHQVVTFALIVAFLI